MLRPACPAVAWAVWAVWTIRAFTTLQTMKARDFSRAFSYVDLLLHTGFSKEGQGASIGELELARSLIKACSAPLMERAILRIQKTM